MPDRQIPLTSPAAANDINSGLGAGTASLPNGMPGIPPFYGPGSPVPSSANSSGKKPVDFVIYHDNPIPLWTSWDVVTTTTALDAHTLGQFYQSGQLADAMTADDAFDAVLQTRVLGLISRPFRLLPSKRGDPKLAKRARDTVAELWGSMLPSETLSNIFLWWLLMGFSIAQPIWGYREKLWVPTQVQPWHPTNSWFDVSSRYYVANSMEGPVYIQPGRGDWMILAPFGQYRGWLRGAVRAVSIPWLARQYALRDWARYSEVHGLPIKKIKVPATADGPDKGAILQAFANLGNESTVVLPQGIDNNPATSYDLDLIEAKADTWEAFQGLINKCETRMAIRMLGQNLTTEVSAGSMAAANVHDRVRLDYTRFDAKSMGAIREQLLVPFCEFNFGNGDLAPYPQWDTRPPDDRTAQGRVVSEVAQASMNFANAQAPVDIRALLKLLGVPVLPPGVKPPPPPDPGQKPQGGGLGPSKATSRRSRARRIKP
jgi:phage gp29-like protein